MSEMSERYDRLASCYATQWGPVHAPASLRVLDVVTARGAVTGAGTVFLDVGTGTGALAFEAVRRWPSVRVIGADSSAGMLDEAERIGGATLSPADASRVRWVHAEAGCLPLDDSAVDVAVSSFVLQLVPDRPAALREIRRVLRPGGLLAGVTWLADDTPFPPADAFDDAVVELAIDEPEEADDDRAGDPVSPAAIAAQLRRAGFRMAGAAEDVAVHHWTRDGYLAFKLGFEELSLLSSLTSAQRSRLERLARGRLAALPPGDFDWSARTVYFWGVRPD